MSIYREDREIIGNRFDDEETEYSEVFCEILEEREDAVFCDFAEVQEWIPKALFSEDSEVFREGDSGEALIATWKLEEIGAL